jgi:hypothetical protein
MSTKDLKKLFNDAVTIFLRNERENIINNVAERNLCARLSYYIENLLSSYKLSGYFADPEYNRKQNGEVKTILDKELKVVNIQCDIILHSRGHNIKNDNLVAIEMKKAYQNDIEKNNDRERLRALTKDSYNEIWSNDGKTHPEHVCGYSLGVYMEIDSNNKTCLLEFYEKGQKKLEEILSF